MLDSFNDAIKEDGAVALALERLDRFRKWKNAFELYRLYPQQEVLKETDRIVIWVSESMGEKVVVKVWRRICWGDEARECPRILSFCEAAEELIQVQPPGVAKVLDVGFIGDHLVLIQKYVDGPNLAHDLDNAQGEWKDGVDALAFVAKLAGVVAELHEGGRAHGDIKPANIIVAKTSTTREPVLIDVVDFGPADEGEIRTPKYSPGYPTGKRERDRYAVLKITEEILSVASVPDSQVEFVKSAIKTCMEQPPQLATLDPLIETISKVMQPLEPIRRVVTLRSTTMAAGQFVSDEGVYYVSFPSNARITLTGATEELNLRVNPRRRSEILDVWRRSVAQSKVAIAHRRATGTLDADIVIEFGVQDYSELAEFIASLSSTETSGEPIPETQDEEAGDTDAVGDSLEEDALVGALEGVEPQVLIDVPALWKTLIEVEGEQFTEGFAGATTPLKRRRRHLVKPFF